MKRNISFFLAVILMISVMFCGCSKDSNANNYVVNNDGIINIGVLLPLSGENTDVGSQISDGINFASTLAPTVNLGESYMINILVQDVNRSIDNAKEEFQKNNVAAVICAGTDKERTEAVVSAFKGTSTALVFTDCYSNEIINSENALSISIPYNYQTSVAASYFNDEGFSSGAVISAGDEYGKNVSKLFKDTFISGGGTSVSEYYYNCSDANFNANTIVGSEFEFVYISGTEKDAKNIFLELKSAGAKMPVILSEIYDKTELESEKFNDVMFISKFERDDNNYIGSDFIKSYSNFANVNSSEITSAVAYGYDAYMMIYGALMSFNSESHSAAVNSGESASESKAVEIKASQVVSELKSSVHMGVTDSIAFNDKGLVNTNFLYIDSIENSNAIMLNRYNYNNESN